MSLSARGLRVLPWLMGVLCLAGLEHIASILAMPRLAPRNAYLRLEERTPLGRLSVLDPITAQDQIAPFEDPAMAMGICRYDLTRGPLRVRGRFEPNQLTLLSLHDRFGEVFHSMSERSAIKGALDLIILTPAQLASLEAYDREDELPSELRVTAPSPKGFVLLRAFAPQAGDVPLAQERLRTIACGGEPMGR
ncbi:MAG: DUF1254 domain-containing protein [Alphaproteobacteria bacterium]|nr:DUF1254 domain-containing protein [Alphaproteobacteria bacterium]